MFHPLTFLITEKIILNFEICNRYFIHDIMSFISYNNTQIVIKQPRKTSGPRVLILPGCRIQYLRTKTIIIVVTLCSNNILIYRPTSMWHTL